MKDSSQNVRLSSKVIPRRLRLLLWAGSLCVRRYGGPVIARCCCIALSAVFSARRDGSEYSRLIIGGGDVQRKLGVAESNTFRYHSIYVPCGSNDA